MVLGRRAALPPSSGTTPTSRPWHRRVAVAAVAAMVMAGLTSSYSALADYAPTLQTDRAAYAAGDLVTIAGQGFAPGETVWLSAVHADGAAEPGMGHEPWTATADPAGHIDASWTINAADAFGRQFVVRAAGGVSGGTVSPAFLRAPRVAASIDTVVAGEPITITGHDFAAGETVRVQVTHADGTAEPAMAHEPSVATVRDDGSFALAWSPMPGDLMGAALLVHASGDVFGSVGSASLRRIASVVTDKNDYQPTETAIIRGRGFAPGEVVAVSVRHLNTATDGNGHAPFFVNANADGAFTTSWYVDPDDSLGSKFLLSGTGVASGVTGQSTFWDASPNIVISQVYGAGGNAGAIYNADYVELFNRGAATVSLTGYSVQYASAAGTGNFGGNPVVALSGTLAPGQYFLVKQVTGGATGAALPTPDATGTVNMSGTAGKVILANTASGLACNGGSTPCSAAQLATIVDLVGYGTTANFFEGAPAPAPSATASLFRGSRGCTDTDNNASDFATGAPGPRNKAAAFNVCGPLQSSMSINDVSRSEGNAGTTAFAFTVTLSLPAGPGGVTFDIATADDTAVAPGDYTAVSLTSQTIPEGSSTYAFTVQVNGDATTETNERFFVNLSHVTGAVVGDAQGQGTITNDDADATPFVSSISPANGASFVPAGSNIIVTFSEAVTTAGAWATIECELSGVHAASVSGGPTTFTLNPTDDFTFGESCTVAVFGALVTDQDVDDPPDTMASDFSSIFLVGADPCTTTFTPIYSIQGSGLTPALTGAVSTKGVVVGDYEYPGAGSTANYLRGFFIQDLAGDGDPSTSDGLFVFNGNSNSVTLGDVVHVSGTAEDFQGQTQIGSVTSIRRCGVGAVTPVDVTLPVSSPTDFERYEGMLVRLPQMLRVTEHFQLGRFGQVTLSSSARLQQPTNVVAPGAAANALQAQNNLNRIVLDDALQNQNADPIVFARNGNPLSATNTLRGGDTATGIVGVLNYTWAGNAASGNTYRVRPVNALGGVVNFVEGNPRPASAPNVGGTVKVVGMNLLNFFNTFAGCTAGVGGAPLDCRGAASQAEFDRQWPKTVAAILAMNPDVVGVNELENDGYGATSALQFLVDRLNAASAPGTFAFIDVDANTGVVNAMGADAIRVAILYKPAVVAPAGATAALNTEAFVNGGDDGPRNRASLAQAFSVNGTGAAFVLNVNHLKSKGSACNAPDAGDGQGNCAQVRVNAANALAAWLASDPTGTGDPDVLMVGDYNSYAMEEPITALKNAGFTNLIESFLGIDAYSYVFDGQWGYLDHALASTSLVGQVSGVGDYHINSDEPSVLDYTLAFKSALQQTTLYAPDQFRISDHDPVVVGLTLDAAPTVASVSASPEPSVEGQAVVASASFSDPAGALDAPFTCTVDYGDGSGALVGSVSGTTCTGPSHVYASYGTYTVTVTVTDRDGETSAPSTAIHDVNFAFSGFLGPVDDLPAVNLAKAGQSVPLTFGLDGYQGLQVLSSVVSAPVACDASGGLSDVEEAVTAGGSALQYDLATGLYTYVWKTDKAWAGQCRQLTLTTVDGESYSARFNFAR